MGKKVSRTTFTTRGRIAGLVRDEAPAGTGQNRTTRSANRDDTAGQRRRRDLPSRPPRARREPPPARPLGRAIPSNRRTKKGRAPIPGARPFRFTTRLFRSGCSSSAWSSSFLRFFRFRVGLDGEVPGLQLEVQAGRTRVLDLRSCGRPCRGPWSARSSGRARPPVLSTGAFRRSPGRTRLCSPRAGRRRGS